MELLTKKEAARCEKILMAEKIRKCKIKLNTVFDMQKVDKKEMIRNYNKIISLDYCNAYFLLRKERPVAYSHGPYGWECDFYNIDGVLISIGYRPVKNKNTIKDCDLVKRYEKKAVENKENCGDILRELIARLCKNSVL